MLCILPFVWIDGKVSIVSELRMKLTPCSWNIFTNVLAREHIVEFTYVRFSLSNAAYTCLIFGAIMFGMAGILSQINSLYMSSELKKLCCQQNSCVRNFANWTHKNKSNKIWKKLATTSKLQSIINYWEHGGGSWFTSCSILYAYIRAIIYVRDCVHKC